MDPMEDPDDILRAHRSREKSYLFDVAFDFTATQVRGAGPGDTLCPTCEGALRGPPTDPQPPSTACLLSGSHPTVCAPICTHVRLPAWRVHSLLPGHTQAGMVAPTGAEGSPSGVGKASRES